jgi:hypothetical protein
MKIEIELFVAKVNKKNYVNLNLERAFNSFKTLVTKAGEQRF